MNCKWNIQKSSKEKKIMLVKTLMVLFKSLTNQKTWKIRLCFIARGYRISLEGMMLKLKLQYFGHVMQRVDSLEKTLMLGGIGMTEDEMAGWHHRLDGHEFGWTPGVGNGQGDLVCCNWHHKESDTTERLHWTKLISSSIEQSCISRDKNTGNDKEKNQR